MSNEQKIRDLFEKMLGAKVPSDDEPLANLPGWDSLRHAEFIIALQREFKIRLTPAEIAALVNLSAAFKIVGTKT
jgi:acyl carrier protein